MNENEIVRTLMAERMRLSALIWTIVRDSHASEDLLQEVTLRALDERERFQDADHLLAWARVNCRHRAIDHIRVRQGRARILENHVLDLLGEDLEERPSEVLASRLDALRVCLSKLPSKSRELISLRYGKGLRANVVAKQLGRSADAVYQSLSRLHKQLRNCVNRNLTS